MKLKPVPALPPNTCFLCTGPAIGDRAEIRGGRLICASCMVDPSKGEGPLGPDRARLQALALSAYTAVNRLNELEAAIVRRTARIGTAAAIAVLLGGGALVLELVLK